MEVLDDKQLIIRYLFSELPAEDRDRLEERYFLDDNYYIRLLVVEDELINSYVRGEFTAAERERFERCYLTTSSRAQRVQAASGLLGLIDVTPPSILGRLRDAIGGLFGAKNLALQFSLAGLVLLLLGGLCWLLLGHSRRSQSPEQAQSNSQRRESNQHVVEAPDSKSQGQPDDRTGPERTPTPPAPQASPEPPRGKSRSEPHQTKSPAGRILQQKQVARVGSTEAVTYELPQDTFRTLSPGGRPQEPLVIRRNTKLVRIKVHVGASRYETYDVSLQKVGGGVVWTRGISKKDSSEWINIELPASDFKGKDFILRVSARTPDGKTVVLAFHELNVVRP